MIDKETLQWISDHGKGVAFHVPGAAEVALVPEGFSVQLPPPDPLPKTLEVETLSALASYVNGDLDEIAVRAELVLVDGPCTVRLLGAPDGRHRQRPIYVAALRSAGQPSIIDGRWHGVEDAIEQLLSCFDPSDHRDELVAILSRARSSSDIQQVDDGVHQTITTEQGKVTLGRDKLPSPAMLRPRMTFTGEVETTEHPYIVRARSGNGVEIKFMEADGGAWMLSHKMAVADKLRELLTESLPVLY